MVRRFKGQVAEARLEDFFNLPAYRMLAFGAYVFCVLSLVDGLFSQFQIALLGGRIVVTNSILRFVFLFIPVLGALIFPKIRKSELPMRTWLVCIAFLLADAPHLILARGLTVKEAFTSYSDYYLLLLMGPALLSFSGAIRERVILRVTVVLLVLCALIGLAQYFTGQPLLPTESVDGKFEVNSSNFFDEIRGFSLFTSGLGFGLFCALCGPLGIALARTSPLKGSLLFLASAIACFSTLTRLSYLVFACACIYALVLTFGKNPGRGLWLPLIYFVLGIATIFTGSGSASSGSSASLQSSGSLLMRLEEWTYYSGVIANAGWIDKLFGLGTVLGRKNLIPIDNVPLALALHVGIVGLALFSIFLFQVWLYLRHEALDTKQPFIIAAASFWSTLMCAGIFNIALISFGAVFTLVILCDRTRPEPDEMALEHSGVRDENAYV